MNWTHEQSQWLREIIQAGNYSYSEITRLYNKTFRVTVTRNSILGRAHRMGLLKKAVPRFSKPKKVARAARALAVGPRWAFGPSPRSDTSNGEPPPVSFPALSTGYLPKRRCLWPDEPICTDAATTGAYCDNHAALAYRVPPPKRRTQRLFFKDNNPLPGMLEQEGERHGTVTGTSSDTASARFETPDAKAT